MEHSSQGMDARSNTVAGLLQVRPKGATKVVPSLFLEEKESNQLS